MALDLEKLRVLLVEDQDDARDIGCRVLREIGVTQIFESSDGAQALTLLRSKDDLVDVVVCDWNMPVMNGVDLLREVRMIDKKLPFLMVTGRGDVESVVEAKDAGVTGYIRKPYTPQQLEAKIRIVTMRAKHS